MNNLEDDELWYSEEPSQAEVISISTKKKITKEYKPTMKQFVYPLSTIEEIANVKRYYITKTKEEYYSNGYNTKYRDYCIFCVGINTGLRISDLLSIQFKHLLTQNHKWRTGFTICEKKRRKARKVVITPTIKNYFILYFMNDNIDTHTVDLEHYVFPSKKQGSDGSCKLSENQFSHRFKKDMQKCIELNYIEDKNYNTHTLRKTFAYMLYEQTNHDISLVSQTLMHDSVDVTMRYLGLTDTRVLETMKNLQL